MPKNAQKFYCEKCDFGCSKRSNYEKHLRTAKHTMVTEMVTDSYEKNARYYCECGKSYKHRQNLYVHRKNSCTYTNAAASSNVVSDESENSESETEKICKRLMPMFKEMVMDMAPALQPNHTVNNINDNRNFNINMFLNDQCKDAMNLTDFVDSIQLTLEDVISIGEQGQTRGFASILIDKLSSMDLHKRPLHCSDVKRETLYIKNNDEWNQETEDRPQMKCAIDHISKKGLQTAPDLDIPEDKMCNTLFEMGKTPIDHKKIISKVAKEVKV